MQREKRRYLIGGLFLTIIVIAGITAGVLYWNSPKQRFQRYFSSGQKYLAELNYDEAIAAFDAALEIMPNSVESYTGLANSYLGKQNYEMAVITYQKSLDVEEQWETYVEIANTYEAAGDIENASISLEKGMEKLGKDKATEEDIQKLIGYYRNIIGELEEDIDPEKVEEYYYKLFELLPEDKEIAKKIEEIERKKEIEKYLSDIEKSVEKLLADNNYMPDSLLFSDELKTLADKLTKPVVFKSENGLYIGIYPQGYIYYGEMENGERSGQGKWFNQEICCYSGMWKDDYPNGAGEERHKNVTDGTPIITTGNFVDGFIDGDITMTFTNATFKFKAVRGDGVTIGIQPNGDSYCARITNSNGGIHDLLTPEKFGVLGAKKGFDSVIE